MALKLIDVIEEMKRAIADPSQGSAGDVSGRILGLAGDFLHRALVRDPARGLVAILMVVPEDEQLTFVYPQHLARGNTLPIDRESFAGRVVLSRAPLVENNVPNEPHKDFFERIPDERGSVRPIQRMVAAPLMLEARAIGVVEVSRTGSTPTEAGAEFSTRDAENLGKCCRAFAPFIARTWRGDASR